MVYFFWVVQLLVCFLLPIYFSRGLLKLQKTNFLKCLIWFNFPVAMVAFGFLSVDFIGMQNDLGIKDLLLSSFILIAPFLFAFTYIIYLALFFTLVDIIKRMRHWSMEYSVYFVTFLFSIIFQYIWWKYFYTSVSLMRRVVGWNIVTVVFPWLPVLGAMFWVKRTSRNKHEPFEVE